MAFLVGGLAVQTALPTRGFAAQMVVASELPWSTVTAVLKRCAAVSEYSYAALVSGYQDGTVTVAVSGSGYLVTVSDTKGILDQIIIDAL